MERSITNRAALKSLRGLLVAALFFLLPFGTIASAQTGWAVGNMGTILYFDGTKWTVEGSDITTSNLNGVALSGEDPWAVGDAVLPGPKGTIAHYDTTQGKWVSQESNTPNSLRAVFFPDDDPTHSNGWAVGDNGTILWYNGDAGWIAQNSGTTKHLYGVFFTKHEGKYVGMAVGAVDAKNKPTILRTKDGARKDATWEAIKTDTLGATTAARGVRWSGLSWWVVGEGNFGVWYYATDTKRWGQLLKRNKSLLGIQGFKNTNTAWVVGDPPENVMKTANGNDWKDKSFGQNVTLRAVFCTDPMTCWVVGDTGTIYSTANDGKDWGKGTNTQEAPQQTLNGVVIIPKKIDKDLKLDQRTSPGNGTAGVSYLNVAGSGFPAGSINPANVVIYLATDCRGDASAKTSAVGIVGDGGDSKSVSFLLPGLVPGNYFVSISDWAEDDANFESTNCSEVSVSQ